MFRVAIAFIRRDFLIWTSYRLAYVWQLVTMVGSTIALYVIGNLVGGGIDDQLDRYGGSYFDFVLVGFGFLQYLGAVTGAFNDAIRDGQTTGTLEVILTSPHRLPTILIGSGGFYHLIGALRLLIVFGFGRLAFGLWPHVNYGAALVTIVLSVLCFASLGLMGGAFTLAFKRGNPVLGIYGLINAALGGLIVPVEILPAWLQPLSVFLPLTHALEAMRLAMKGEPAAKILPSWIAIVIMALILLPSGALLFRMAINYAKDEGSLVQY